MQPRDPRSTSPRARTPLNRDAALSEARSQIDAIYNTSSQPSSSARSSIRPITADPSAKPRTYTATRATDTSGTGSAATFTLPHNPARQGHRPIVRRSISDIHRPARPLQSNTQRPASSVSSQPSGHRRETTTSSSASSTSTATPLTTRTANAHPSSPRESQPIDIQPQPQRIRSASAQQSSSQTDHTQISPTSAATASQQKPSLSAPSTSETATTTPTPPPKATTSTTTQPEHAAQPGAPRQPPESQKAAWQQYHSAWQNYYQQYYERYYLGQVKKAKDELAHQAQTDTNSTPTPSATDPSRTTDSDNGIISKEEALDDLRSGLLGKIQASAKKIRQSRHFVPVMAALTVMLVFLFLQYNRVLFSYVAAWTTPSTLDAQNYIISPYDTNSVGPDPKLVIPKIAVDVPIIWDANAASQASLNAAMDKGVVWFNIPGANAKPGEVGNFVLSGHSSNDWLDNGKYKFIFARLEQMQKGDNVYVNYNGTRYTYTVTGTRVVKPTDVQALQTNASKPTMTLITCVPLGTALNRLLVTAEQVSPDPSSANKKSDTSSQRSSNSAAMPGNSPSFIQRVGNLFSGRNN